DPSQLDLPARHEAEEQNKGRVFRGEGALRLHASPELFVESFNRVCSPQRLPLRFREGKKRQEFVAAFAQARDDTGASFAPRALERCPGATRGLKTRGVHDAMEVITDLRQRVLRRFPFEIAQLVDATALHGSTGPHLAARTTQP